MGKRLGALIDNAMNNGGVIAGGKIEYEICKEFVVPTLKTITRRGHYELSVEMSEVLGAKDKEAYTPIHFGWMENKVADVVYPAHSIVVIRIGEKYYYIPKELVDNIEKALGAGDTKRIENFEETQWYPRHIEMSADSKEVFGAYLMFSDKMSNRLKNSFNYILPGAGITKFIYNETLINADGVNILKLKDGDIYSYYLKDTTTGDIVDLGMCDSSDLADNLIMDDGELFKIELDLTRLQPRLYSFGEYINGREIKIPSASKRELNVLMKAIQDSYVTLAQLEKFETITGIGHKIMASEELYNSVFIKFPNTNHFGNVIAGGLISRVDSIKARNGIYVPSSHKVLQIMSRVLTDSYTSDDIRYVLQNAVN